MSSNTSTTLPLGCYTSEAFLQKFKQELFEKGWHFVAPVSRFAKSSSEDHVQFDFYQNPFYVLCDVEDPKTVESIDVFYGTYQESESLKKVHSVTTKTGLLFITHEKDPEPFEEYFGQELQEFINARDFRNYPIRKSLVYECNYNFITFIDGYQECLHCQYTHPLFVKLYPTEFYSVETYKNFCRHLASVKDVKGSDKNLDDGLFLYFFPVCALNLYGGGMGCFRVCPTSANTCRMEFDYFFEGLDEEFDEFYSFARQVAIEDLELCESVQENLLRGIYQTGILNPNKEKGVIYYHNLIRERVGLKQPVK